MSVSGEGAQKPNEEEEVDIDLKDPEVNDATQKIQKAFRKRQAKKDT